MINIDKAAKAAIEHLNSTNLPGILYDLDMLPEQFDKDSPRWWFLMGAVWWDLRGAGIRKAALEPQDAGEEGKA